MFRKIVCVFRKVKIVKEKEEEEEEEEEEGDQLTEDDVYNILCIPSRDSTLPPLSSATAPALVLLLAVSLFPIRSSNAFVTSTAQSRSHASAVRTRTLVFSTRTIATTDFATSTM